MPGANSDVVSASSRHQNCHPLANTAISTDEAKYLELTKNQVPTAGADSQK